MLVLSFLCVLHTTLPMANVECKTFFFFYNLLFSLASIEQNGYAASARQISGRPVHHRKLLVTLDLVHGDSKAVDLKPKVLFIN